MNKVKFLLLASARAPFKANHLSLVAEDAADEFEDNVEDGEEFADDVTD